MADIHEVIEKMPQGYQSWLSEHGVGLSGGQGSGKVASPGSCEIDGFHFQALGIANHVRIERCNSRNTKLSGHGKMQRIAGAQAMIRAARHGRSLHKGFPADWRKVQARSAERAELFPCGAGGARRQCTGSPLDGERAGKFSHDPVTGNQGNITFREPAVNGSTGGFRHKQRNGRAGIQVDHQ